MKEGEERRREASRARPMPLESRRFPLLSCLLEQPAQLSAALLSLLSSTQLVLPAGSEASGSQFKKVANTSLSRSSLGTVTV